MELPNGQDWLKVGNDLIEAINGFQRCHNLPLTTKSVTPSIPTETMLDNWDRAFPGTKEMFIKAAQDEMVHRIKMERMKNDSSRLRLLFRWLDRWFNAGTR